MRQKIGVCLVLSILLLVLAACGGAAATPTQPAPTQPAATQPVPTQPVPTQPAPTQPAPTEPAATPTQPASTQAASGHTAAAQAVEDYLAGVVGKDVNKVSTLSCKDWEQQAIQELDSLQAVTAKLDGVACSQTGLDGANALVNCTGKILITYNTENQELDLSLRTYKVSQSGGDWLVCGYKQ